MSGSAFCWIVPRLSVCTIGKGEVCIRLYCVALVILAAQAGGAVAAGRSSTPNPAATASRSAPIAAAFSPLALTIKNAVAANGSALSLHPIQNGQVLKIVSAQGQTKTIRYTRLNEQIGTVSLEEEAGTVTGLFAFTPTTISTLYADGGAEILVFDDAQTVSIIGKGADGNPVCSTWYPTGHQFSIEERRTALAQYARNIGLEWPGADLTTHSRNGGCDMEIRKAQRAQEEADAQLQRQPAVPPLGDFAAPSAGTGQTWNAFDAFYSSFIAAHEGGFTPNDGNGSPANYGINQGANPDVDVMALSQPDAENILYQRYWLASGADRLPAALAMVHGDTAINMGVRAANELLAQSGGDPLAYLDLRSDRYRAIAAANPAKADYLPLWLERVEDLRGLVADGAADDRSLYVARAPERERQAWMESDWGN